MEQTKEAGDARKRLSIMNGYYEQEITPWTNTDTSTNPYDITRKNYKNT